MPNFRLIKGWQQMNLTCVACGEDRSVKYDIAGKHFCNRCVIRGDEAYDRCKEKKSKKVEPENYLETYKKMMGFGTRPINDKPISPKAKKFLEDW